MMEATSPPKRLQPFMRLYFITSDRNGITFTAVGTLRLTERHSAFNNHLGKMLFVGSACNVCTALQMKSVAVGKAGKYEDTGEFALLRNTAEINYQ
jgi:hypothetical protein